MSFRSIPAEGDEAAHLFREILRRLDAIENGSAIAGQVSFGPTIQIGDVLVEITNGVGTHRNIVFTNVLSGATSTITL